MAGRDASRLLAKGILEPESAEQALVPLTELEIKTLRDWGEFYKARHVLLGPLLPPPAERPELKEEAWRVVDGVEKPMEARAPSPLSASAAAVAVHGGDALPRQRERKSKTPLSEQESSSSYWPDSD